MLLHSLYMLSQRFSAFHYLMKNWFNSKSSFIFFISNVKSRMNSFTASRNFISADRMLLPPYNLSVYILVADSGANETQQKYLEVDRCKI
jgi:hypothetical protein